jgi:hypothetical protein
MVEKNPCGKGVAMAETLKQELDTYKKILPTLSSDEGKHALIMGDELIGVFESYGDALVAGYARAGLKPFLIKRISATEIIAYFTRDITPSCPT